jgi:hypothetical protein
MTSRQIRLALLVSAALVPRVASPQSSSLVPTSWFHAIRDESSGERPLVDFWNIETRFSGFSPSRGGDEMADYVAMRAKEAGLEDVFVEGYPSDGKTFFWAFLGEPAWEAQAGTLEMVEPRRERLADFSVDRVTLGRFSTSADVTAELVDVGSGTSPSDFEGKDVSGKIVLASGNAEDAHRQAVWNRGARGIVSFRIRERPDEQQWLSNPTLGNRTGAPGLVPWEGPSGEPPGFLFSLSHVEGTRLRRMLAEGRVVVRAVVKAQTGPGEYKQVSGVVRGTEPELKEVWIKAHTNYRNTGGGNNLTGVGATLEMARVLNRLIAEGILPRPRRTIRFLWSAEHFASTYQFYLHPERLDRVLTFFSVDMTGFDAEKVDGYFRLYRLPHSMPHFLSDVAEEIVESVGGANTLSARSEGFPDPIFAPTGSQDRMYYRVEDFWAPSDHEEMVEGSIGIPSVEFGHPDRFIGTREDSLDKVDPTQMRRSVVTIAATALYLASVDRAGVPALLTVLAEGAAKRMASLSGRALRMVEGASASELASRFREASNLLTQSRIRERATLASVREIDDGASTAAAIARTTGQMEKVADAHESALRERAEELAREARLTLSEPARTAGEVALAKWVPKRDPSIRGPVNLFRPEYGSIWIARKTGNPDVLGTVRLSAAGRFVPYEALNFVDGRRTLLEIRDAVSAEFGAVDAAQIEEYFRFLERLGVVTLSPR